MSSTITEIITLAYESAGIVRIGQPVPATQAEYALRVLQEMLDKWQDDGTQHGLGTVAYADVVYDGKLRSAVRKNLAVELSKGPYKSNLNPLLAVEAVKERNTLETPRKLSYDNALVGPHIYDIETGG